jgi:dipeptidyl aminopeptidase/acylaminoacyl peptidase
MNDVEERTRTAMTVLADQVVPVDLLARLDRSAAVAPRAARARRWLMVAAAAVVVVVVLLSARGLLPGLRPDVIVPAVHPPKVVRLGDGSSASPGRALMEVTLAPSSGHEAATFLVVAGSDEASRVPMPAATMSFRSHLSHDGTRLMLQYDDASTTRLEIMDLRTGSRQDPGGKDSYCPRLSPDNRTVAVWESSVEPDPLVLLDVATAERRVARQAHHPAPPSCNDVAWSPDGSLLAMPDGDGTLVTGRGGQAIARFPNRYAVNGSQSWSPDGSRILLYDQGVGRYVARTLVNGEETLLGDNRIMTVPVGWAGSRIVWLAGTPGHQRLVTTDGEGRGERLWTRFDVGDQAIDTVSWSSALAGTKA